MPSLASRCAGLVQSSFAETAEAQAGSPSRPITAGFAARLLKFAGRLLGSQPTSGCRSGSSEGNHERITARPRQRCKANIRCVAFKPVCRGSLCGFAGIAFDDLMMTVHGIGIYAGENGTAWASPPAQPLVMGGTLLKGEAGEIVYSAPLVKFRSADVCKAWFDPPALREHA